MWVCIAVCVYKLTLWQTDDLSKVYLASRPTTAVIGSSPPHHDPDKDK